MTSKESRAVRRGAVEKVPSSMRTTRWQPTLRHAGFLEEWLSVMGAAYSTSKPNTLASRNIQVIILKQNLDISQQDISSKATLTLFSLFAELERDLISLRTKEALASKKRQGQILGKPKGTIQKSKFDQHVVKIKELLAYGLSMRKIAKVLEYTNHIALSTYINKRKLRIVDKKT